MVVKDIFVKFMGLEAGDDAHMCEGEILFGTSPFIFYH